MSKGLISAPQPPEPFDGGLGLREEPGPSYERRGLCYIQAQCRERNMPHKRDITDGIRNNMLQMLAMALDIFPVFFLADNETVRSYETIRTKAGLPRPQR
jgi:hypothetical protein